MANKRQQIIAELVSLFKTNLTGDSPYLTNVYDNVKDKQVFLDEVHDFPTISLHSAGESREYLPGDFKWGYLTVEIKIYVHDEDASDRLEDLFTDIETILDGNNTLVVGGKDLCTDIRILSIIDDEGLLNPDGVGEITLQVQYEV